MKLDFQRAVLNRIPKIKKDPDRYWRQVFFICDEYLCARFRAWGSTPGKRRKNRGWSIS
jgi:hypothetical protein